MTYDMKNSLSFEKFWMNDTAEIKVKSYGTESVVLEIRNSSIYNGLVKVVVDDKLIQYFEGNLFYYEVKSEFEEFLYNYAKKKLTEHRAKFKHHRKELYCIIH